jgi:outer membrane protein OmpA-like peptidoglycan-associated protein
MFSPDTANNVAPESLFMTRKPSSPTAYWAVRRAVRLATAALALSVGTALVPAVAQTPTEAQIRDALKPPPPKALTRGIVPGQAPSQARAAEESRALNALRHKTRAITVEERKQIAEIVKTKPSIDIEVNFDYDSSAIGPQAVPALTALGRALSSHDFRGSTFLLAGHTDARGSDEYNRGLSERRAEAVKRFLADKFQVPAESLLTIGHGEEQLKNLADPNAAENRRVQIVNLQSQ